MIYIYQKGIQEWLHFKRFQETASILESLSDSPLKILEIGGGDGYIASIFSKEGHDIFSMDLQPRYPSSFQVKQMSAEHLIFPKNTFDIIFSSNVLEHINELSPVFKEMQRVAKHEAQFIFFLPTPTWRLISSFWYFFRLIKAFLTKLFYFICKRSKTITTDNNVYENQVELEKVSLYKKIKHIILHPHGAYPSFLHELYYFSPFRWKRLFINNGFKILSHKRGPLFYSGESFFKFRFIKYRKLLAKYFFSSIHIYILKTKK
ncbi:MAG: class I SAM-dependent methyltransferase [Bacteroidetes bacterium]|nr:class I SAM-dependent methyltransferase [Bacteroidota bacterium]